MSMTIGGVETKFRLTEETKEHTGKVTLHRIRAMRDIMRGEEVVVHAGDLGGWVEKAENLSQHGDCWIADDAIACNGARVCGDAWVSGKAWITGEASVFDNAQVCGNALVQCEASVSGNAWVGDTAWVGGNATISGNARVGGEETDIEGEARIRGNMYIMSNRHHTTITSIGDIVAVTFSRDAKGTIFAIYGGHCEPLQNFLGDIAHTKNEKIYKLAAELAKAQLDTTPMKEENPNVG